MVTDAGCLQFINLLMLFLTINNIDVSGRQGFEVLVNMEGMPDAVSLEG